MKKDILKQAKSEFNVMTSRYKSHSAAKKEKDKIKGTNIDYKVLAGPCILIVFLINTFPVVGIVLLAVCGLAAYGYYENKRENKPLVCPKCGGDNIQVINTVKEKGHGLISNLFHLIMVIFVWWVWIFVLLFRGKKYMNKTKGVCMNCGKQFAI